YPIDISNPTKPKMLTQYVTAPGRVHGLDMSDDGNRAYLAIAGTGAANPTRAPATPDNNGLLILDTTQVQSRTPNPTIRCVRVVVSKLGLETHDPKNCAKVLPDLAGLSGFTYGSHYCSVDNKKNATTLACGYFENGLRVFDIRNPAQPKEIAYYNPPSVTTPS